MSVSPLPEFGVPCRILMLMQESLTGADKRTTPSRAGHGICIERLADVAAATWRRYDLPVAALVSWQEFPLQNHDPHPIRCSSRDKYSKINRLAWCPAIARGFGLDGTQLPNAGYKGGVPNDRRSRHARRDLFEQLQPLY